MRSGLQIKVDSSQHRLEVNLPKTEGVTGRRGCNSGACGMSIKESGRGSKEARVCPGLVPQELVPEGLRPESGWGEGGSIASLQRPASPGGRGAGLLHQRSSQGNRLSTVVFGRGESSVQLAAAALVVGALWWGGVWK